ncbi:helix-turn-helix domain-containing protein [Acholeplasma laidlawii]|uniref:helix-turn-helix domain-containing protein n=1 Tax=Acholeplasma laidlawii TaxID=2148 RepID=UPI0021F69D66|nr:helix-turn-helix transcriptional regulator [Acholeplasma laidlawii]
MSTMKNKNMIDISDFVGVETIQVVTHNLINRFKLRRKESRMTQRLLSQLSGVSYASVRRFETSGDISFASLLKLSEALGLLSEFNQLFSRPIIKDIRRGK